MSAYDTNVASTDHTAAFTAALAAASALVTSGFSKVRIILDSRQKYTLGGAVQSGANGQFAQVPLPFHDDTAAGTIELVGMPRGNDYTYISAGASGTVIESTLGAAPAFSAATGIASIFGGPASFRSAPGTYPTEFSYLKFATQDITIRSASPVIAGIDCGWVTGFSWQGLLSFDTDFLATNGIGYQGFTPCTAPQAIPIIFPFILDWFGATGDALVVAGWTHGPMLGDYLHARRVTVFGATGAALLVDAASQINRIDYLTDWNNAYGIGTITGAFADNTVISPTTGATAAPGSKGTLSATKLAARLSVGSWQIQTSQGGGMPASTQRVHDGMDANVICAVDCPVWASVTDGGTVNHVPDIVGFGGTNTGILTMWHVKDNNHVLGPNYQTAPTSGTVIRNPVGRDCLVSIQATNGATITAVNVNGNVQSATTTYPVILPANGNYSITYTGTAPELAFMCI